MHLVFWAKRGNLQNDYTSDAAAQRPKRLWHTWNYSNRPKLAMDTFSKSWESWFECDRWKLSLKIAYLRLAKSFIDSGDFVWNSGHIYLEKLVVLSIAFEEHMPGLGRGFWWKISSLLVLKKKLHYIRAYNPIESISIDLWCDGKSLNQVYVLRVRFLDGQIWGSWNSLYDVCQKRRRKM